MTAYHDLALELVEEAAGPELRSQVAKIMLLDPSRESQAPYAIRSVAAHGRPLVVDEAHRWLVEHLADPELSLTAVLEGKPTPGATIQKITWPLEQQPPSPGVNCEKCTPPKDQYKVTKVKPFDPR